MKKVIHPFLFAIVPALFLFAYNIVEVHPTDLLPPITFSLIGTAILFFLSRLLTKSYVKSGIITSLFLILFFSYGHIRDLIYSAGIRTLGSISVQTTMCALWVLIFILGTLLVIKTRRDFLPLTKYLNVVAIILIVISVINTGIYLVSKPSYVPEEPIYLRWGNSTNLPDIYYIILDVYARQDVLEEDFNYDNSEFINYLTDKGFYVATKSMSNYDYTTYSLSSSLNMDYVEIGQKRGALYEMVADSEVSRFLKEVGYTYIYIDGGISGFANRMTKYADFTLRYKSDAIFKRTTFSDRWVGTTALSPVAWHFLAFLSEDKRRARLYPFDRLAEMPYVEGPKFVYAHIVLPHPPYIFDRDGNPVRPDLFYDIGNILKPTQHMERYVNQLIFTTKKVREAIDGILSNSNEKPIIILQGDQGPWWVGGGRYKILNAYYLPGKDKHPLYETISPINSFRVIFNLYFDTNYPLLEDKSYKTGGHP